MALYMLQAKYTPEAMRNIAESGSNREEEARTAVARPANVIPSARLFHFDDIGALISQHHRGQGSCNHGGEVDYPVAVQRSSHVQSPFYFAAHCLY